MSSRQMHRFLDSLGAGPSEGRRLSSFDAMQKFRERVERHNQEAREQQALQEESKQNHRSRVEQIWREASQQINQEKGD
jgi:hypothetical protein